MVAYRARAGRVVVAHRLRRLVAADEATGVNSATVVEKANMLPAQLGDSEGGRAVAGRVAGPSTGGPVRLTDKRPAPLRIGPKSGVVRAVKQNATRLDVACTGPCAGLQNDLPDFSLAHQVHDELGRRELSRAITGCWRVSRCVSGDLESSA
ncbi:hypothetical protein D9M68_728760 [compost metagenome]